MNNAEMRGRAEIEQQTRGWISYGLREIEVMRMRPDVFGIETTSICNLRCVFCPYDEMTRTKRNMDVAAFREFVSGQCDHVASVGLHHFGEPFLNKRLPEYIAVCTELGIRTTLSTNATRITESSATAVIEAGLSRMIVSLDGTEAGEYELLRVGAEYDEVMANIQLFLAAKVGVGRGPFVQLQFIQTPENEGKWEVFRDRWLAIAGVDQVVLRDERTHGGQRIRHDGYVERGGERLPCRYLWESIVVLQNGDVVPCCKDYDGKEVLGNVFSGQTLEAIWNGPRMQELRSAHVEGRFAELPLCGPCNEWPGHEAMNPIDSVTAYARFRQYKRSTRAQRVYRRTFE